MKDKLAMESLQDFLFCVAKDAWESELDEKVVEPAVAADVIIEAMKPIQLFQVRVAWQSAHRESRRHHAQQLGAASACLLQN